MKLDNIEWLFFDVGSTLVSEEKPFLHRLHEIADAVNEPFLLRYRIRLLSFIRKRKRENKY